MKAPFFLFPWLCMITYFASCVRQITPEEPRLNRTLPENFDIQGHRGARGLMPENTIPAFIHAMQLGVNTLEMDVVVSADSQVVVSHEPWFSSEFSSRPNMDVVLPVEEESLSLYEMPYHEIRRYDVGQRGHRGFPRQQRINTFKPLLSQVVDTCEKYWKAHNLPPIRYNVEIKSRPDWDRWRTPPVNVFCRLVYQTLQPFNLGPRLSIQSFDPRALMTYHELDPSTPLVWLSEQGHTPEQIEETLGFKTQIYSPQWKTLTAEVISSFHQKGYLVIPWTVNDTSDLMKVMNMEVDGIITDYPDVALHLAGRLKKTSEMNP